MKFIVFRKATLSVAILLLWLTNLPLEIFAQTSYTTGFESPTFVSGNVQGQNGWGYLSNSPTKGVIETAPSGSPASFGAQSLAIRTNNVDFFGVSNHLYSALIDPAGETGSTIGGVLVAAPYNQYNASFYYQAPATPVISTRADGRFAELNPSSKGTAAGDPANRYAQIRVINDTNTAAGKVRLEIGWYSVSTSTFTVATVVQNLNWGEWYRFDYSISFCDGLNGASPNDTFKITIKDINGSILGMAVGSTWEAAYKTGSFGGGTTPRAVNGFDLWSQTGPNNALVGYIDNFSESVTNTANPCMVPDVTINQAASQSDPATGTNISIHFTAQFSEPVTGFGNSQTDVNLSGTAGATTTVVSQIAPFDGTTYDVAVSGMTMGGTVTASIPAGAAQDVSNNPNIASTSTDNTVTYVVPYSFNWFYYSELLLRENVLNQVTAGSNVTIKFSLNGYKGNPYSSPPTSQLISCSTFAPIGPATVINRFAPDPYYSALYDFYQTTWQTQANWKYTCRNLTLYLTDGTTKTLYFYFK